MVDLSDKVQDLVLKPELKPETEPEIADRGLVIGFVCGFQVQDLVLKPELKPETEPEITDHGLGSDCEDMMNSKNSLERCGSSSSDGGSHLIKTCADCGTTKTPLWRGGPAGPKSLCNACGIRSRKKRRALLGLTKEDKKQKKTSMAATSTSGGDSQTSGLTTNKSSNKGGFCLKRKLVALGKEVVLQRPRSTITKQRRKPSEVEQAALLLMALSCGSVYV